MRSGRHTIRGTGEFTPPSSYSVLSRMPIDLDIENKFTAIPIICCHRLLPSRTSIFELQSNFYCLPEIWISAGQWPALHVLAPELVWLGAVGWGRPEHFSSVWSIVQGLGVSAVGLSRSPIIVASSLMCPRYAWLRRIRAASVDRMEWGLSSAVASTWIMERGSSAGDSANWLERWRVVVDNDVLPLAITWWSC